MSAAYRIMPLSVAYVNLWAVSVAAISSFSLSYFLSIQMSVTSKQKTWVSLWMPKLKSSFRFWQYKWLTLLSGFIHPSSEDMADSRWPQHSYSTTFVNCIIWHNFYVIHMTLDVWNPKIYTYLNPSLHNHWFSFQILDLLRESLSKTNGKIMVLSDDKSVTWNYKETCKLSCFFPN